jgi:hypothetical protein
MNNGKKRSAEVAIVCNFFSCICGGFILLATILLLLRIFIGSIDIGSTVETVSSISLNDTELAGTIAKNLGMDDEGSYNKWVLKDKYGIDLDDDKISAGEYIFAAIYENEASTLEQQGIDERDVEKFIEKLDMSSLTDELIDNYMGVITGEEDEASITSKMIIDTVKDNEKLINNTLGIKFDDSDYDELEAYLDRMELEKYTTVTDDSIDIPDWVRTLINLFYGDNITIYVVSGLVIFMMSLLIVLMNLHKPYVVFNYLGINTLITGIAGIVFSQLLAVLFEEIAYAAEYGEDLINEIGSLLKDILFKDSIIFTAIGIILIIIFIVISVIRKIMIRKSEESF